MEDSPLDTPTLTLYAIDGGYFTTALSFFIISSSYKMGSLHLHLHHHPPPSHFPPAAQEAPHVVTYVNISDVAASQGRWRFSKVEANKVEYGCKVECGGGGGSELQGTKLNPGFRFSHQHGQNHC